MKPVVEQLRRPLKRRQSLYRPAKIAQRLSRRLSAERALVQLPDLQFMCVVRSFSRNFSVGLIVSDRVSSWMGDYPRNTGRSRYPPPKAYVKVKLPSKSAKKRSVIRASMQIACPRGAGFAPRIFEPPRKGLRRRVRISRATST